MKTWIVLLIVAAIAFVCVGNAWMRVGGGNGALTYDNNGIRDVAQRIGVPIHGGETVDLIELLDAIIDRIEAIELRFGG